MCNGLAEARCDTVQDDVHEVMVTHLGIDIESIDIVLVFSDCACLSEIPEFIESPIWLVVVIMVLSYGVLYCFLSIIPSPVSLPPFQHFCFTAQANVSELLLFFVGLDNVEKILLLKNLYLLVLHVSSKSGGWWYISSHSFHLIELLLLWA